MPAAGDSREPPVPPCGDPAPTELTPEPGATAPPLPAAPPLADAPGPPARPSVWPLLGAGVLYAGLLAGFVSLAGGDLLDRAEGDPWTFLWVQVVDDGILAAVAMLFGRLGFPGSWSALGFRRVGLRWWAVGAGAGSVAAVLAWVVSAALEAGGQAIPAHPVEALLGRVGSLPELLLVLTAVTVPVAFGEEAFFRGFAYHVLRARWGIPVAMAATALLFALAHGLQPGAWVPVLPVGLVLAALVESSGSLVPAIVGHAVVNALAVLVG